VLLHGMSTTMYDFASLGAGIDDSGYIYACPNAPFPMPLRDNYTGYSWYADRPGVEPQPEDHPEAEDLLEGFMRELLEVSGTPPGRVAIGGFAQGATVALRLALPRPELFAGVMSFSGALDDIEAMRPLLPAQRTMPVYMSHGGFDTRRYERIDATRRFLESEGYTVDFGQYAMGHEISEDVLRDVGRWLHLHLPPRQS
jgi:phospholipase/carboxylesterase